ncbi:MAG: hypothetical protein PHT69_09880 [Bacteroidales bacterium]|nr:hypothetical protein [Bacteroidales bacterium]
MRDYAGIIFKLLYQPHAAWVLVKDKEIRLSYLVLTYALPFIFAGAISKLLMYLLQDGFNSELLWSFLFNILSVSVMFCVSIVFINQLTTRYGGHKDINLTGTTIIFGFSPLFIMSLFSHFIFIQSTAMIWGTIISAYTLASGFKNLMMISESKLTGFTIISLIIFLGVGYFSDGFFSYLFRVIIK